MIEFELRTRVVDICHPDTGDVKQLTITELNAEQTMEYLMNGMDDSGKNFNYREYSMGVFDLIAWSVTGDDGKPMFTIEQARKLPKYAADALSDAILKLNKLKKDSISEDSEGKGDS